MTKQILVLAMFSALFLTSCKQNPPKETETDTKEVSAPEKENETNLLIGSWVEPIPGQENKTQGIKIDNDSVASSINMATLVYKKWWKKDNNLILVSESIGNHTSGIDTIAYKIVNLTDTDLELKDGEYTIKYKRQ